MNSVHKFDYTVDHGHSLITKAHEVQSFLSGLCPVLVGKLRAEAEKQSSSRLFVGMQKFASEVILAHMLGLKQEGTEARLFLAISLDTLATRYRARQLEPELHAGDESSIAWAGRQVEMEDVQTKSDETSSPVNSASDGIA
jgi:hypothetical protein